MKRTPMTKLVSKQFKSQEASSESQQKQAPGDGRAEEADAFEQDESVDQISVGQENKEQLPSTAAFSPNQKARIKALINPLQI